MAKSETIEEWSKTKITIVKAILYTILIGTAISILIPYYWMTSLSFKEMGEIFARTLWPKKPTLINYINLMVHQPNVAYLLLTGLYPRWFMNSAIVAVCWTTLALFLCSLGGFGFAKYRFRGREALFMILLLSMMIPFTVTFIPVFGLMTTIGWVDTYWALIIPGSADAWGIFFMRQYISGSVPDEMLDAARIDGCSEFRIYWNIVLPVIKPALAATGIFLFIGSWNSYMWPLIMMRSLDMFTVPVGLAALSGALRVEYGMIMAGSFLSTIPVQIVFLALQKYFISGLTIGAVKG